MINDRKSDNKIYTNCTHSKTTMRFMLSFVNGKYQPIKLWKLSDAIEEAATVGMH